MTSRTVREAADTCERSFRFLVEEFEYRADPTRFDSGGFAVRYLGSVLGVEVDWYPRDPLTVWLVRLVDGDFPERASVRPAATLNYFDLEDVEAISNKTRQVESLQLYALPNEENADLLAANLKSCASDLLRGDLSRMPELERRILARARAVAVERYGVEGAARLGW
ncbi:hypothetical protein Vau01_103240 [Virgisporangium aurantiacum]|uniref:Uncharacterized protein n=2 Tax=Virgisporangium aurantiacum TaxID=175570 RepID=A0A8J3ZHB2_9ACTN|nr:hypothetical protein Vau01_103240 [Virgisporangium aurantiacum]